MANPHTHTPKRAIQHTSPTSEKTQKNVHFHESFLKNNQGKVCPHFTEFMPLSAELCFGGKKYVITFQIGKKRNKKNMRVKKNPGGSLLLGSPFSDTERSAIPLSSWSFSGGIKNLFKQYAMRGPENVGNRHNIYLLIIKIGPILRISDLGLTLPPGTVMGQKTSKAE